MAEICFAPMEGITTRVYRNVFRRHFAGVDRFYTPFLAATHTHHFRRRELREVEPYEEGLVPQILTADSDDFIWAARFLGSLGYREVDLNLGCPYPTVFTKGKGAGMLRDTDRLRAFLDDIFSAEDLPRISVKTRVGVKSPDEAPALAEIYAAYPLSELIIHPRVREDFYEGGVRMDAFAAMAGRVHCPVSYNGDIRIPEDAERVLAAWPDIHAIMIGRGLITDPSLAAAIRGGETRADDVALKSFLDDLWDAYSERLCGERDVLFKMKELWNYMGRTRPACSRELLDIRKSRTKEEYDDAVRRILG